MQTISIMKTAVDRAYNYITHFIGKITRHYYFEDYVRVYPDGIVFNRFGRKRQPLKNDINNFLNHCKFYEFAAQFIKDKRVADVGCGSGYGCKILKENGAAIVSGSDISKRSIRFAQSRYSDFAEFIVQGITDMQEYHDDSFDISVSSEVLEHVKEYGMEAEVISEMKRITRSEGLLIIGTPNKEMSVMSRIEHGFSFDEVETLFQKNFTQFCIFENALVPFGNKKLLWEKRLSEGKVGIIVTESINLSETVILDDVANLEIKKGIEAGEFEFANYNIDTSRLHNTHSWVVLAVNNK